MKKIFVLTLSTLMFLFGGVAFASAQATTTASTSTATTDTSPSIQDQIAQLLQEIAQLKAQIAALQQQNGGLQNDVQQLHQALQLNAHLRPGMSGEEVKHLQEVLATDPNIFSKDNVTGFFGPLTEDAVKAFQKHFGIDQAGVVGPMTLDKINSLLKEHDVSEQDLSENDLGDLGDKGDLENGTAGFSGSNASSAPSEGEGNNRQGASSEGEHGNGNQSTTTRRTESGDN